ncbi:T6SS phospholipase effector Tle1-like catalytic domain-containing protein [Pseudoxanthomonas dokdonensis]|uniref:T6SS phospholipase effector Tle1-like catalytic domain-containing protein n=1 Tax=Pseudoxanthomonas dokdonensis TaxID=344882 RepID=UPI00071029AC|nr:DUF2235 domain-containing protein [Pseudoxanthomonas dokdonensis]
MGDVFSGGSHRQAGTDDLELYEQLRRQQRHLLVPLLQRHDHPHEYLFFALFDGTGQDVNNPKQLPTNIGHLSVQADQLELDPRSRVSSHYIAGIGTQRNPLVRLTDKAFAYSWDEKIEAMYRQLADQTAEWQRLDKEAKVSVVEVGYSRGAVLVPGFARLVDEYGIADPDGLSFGRDALGNITVVSPHPPLLEPGQVAQAFGLFDPVATNLPANYDARRPSSVVSGLSLLADHEQRMFFAHQTIMEAQLTPDQRFLGAPLAGGHSNIGGGNAQAGLESLAFNRMSDYLNALSDRPLFQPRPLPADPGQYTIYQVEGATAVWGARLDRDGERDLQQELANCKVVDLCRGGEPVDLALAQQFEWRTMTPTAGQKPPPMPDAVASAVEEMVPVSAAQQQADALTDRYLRALMAGDEAGMRESSIALFDSEPGQQWMADSRREMAGQQQQLASRDAPLFAQAMTKLQQLGPQPTVYTDLADMQRVAGVIALEATRKGMPAIDDIQLRDNGHLQISRSHPHRDMLTHLIEVDPIVAGMRPLQESFQQREQEVQQQIQAQQQLELEQQQISTARGLSR